MKPSKLKNPKFSAWNYHLEYFAMEEFPAGRDLVKKHQPECIDLLDFVSPAANLHSKD